MAWSSAVYSFYSDVEPLCSRKLYLAKTVSFFPKDIHRTRRANNYSFLLCASLKVVILLKQACHGHFNVNRRDSNCIKTTTCEMKHYNLQLYREQERNFHWPSSAAFKISFIKSNRQVLYWELIQVSHACRRQRLEKFSHAMCYFIEFIITVYFCPKIYHS